ncbi:MAG: hypothetical protein IJE81_01985 [Oscillospiraceae bacterium]|nr:hypothetical protein [Oscillospiraceae bacterium]MBQ7130447.1 hypothetical protein [Oscillospiraceae bacterium]
MKLKETHKYDDIIHLSRPDTGRRARMSNYDRAAQFSPFAALTGFEAAIEETGRLTDAPIELDEGGKQLLDEQMRAVLEAIDIQPEVTVTWFRYDERKAGGAYVHTTGYVKKIDGYTGRILFTDGQTIPLGEIISITMER